MATFGVKVTGLLFFANFPAKVGDPIHLWLDLTKFTVIPANPLEGTIRGISTPITVIHPDTGKKVSGREYTVEVTDSDMPDGAPTLGESDLVKVECPTEYQKLLNDINVAVAVVQGYGIIDQPGDSVAGSQFITVTLSASQISDGYHTDDIKGYEFQILSGTAADVGLIGEDESQRTGTQVVYRLTGDETENAGHRMIIKLQKTV